MITALTFWLEQLQCEKRGCCWSPLDERNVPWCFFPTNHGYTVESVKQRSAYGKSPLCTLLSHSCTHKLVKIFDFLSFSNPNCFMVLQPVCLSHIVSPPFHLLCQRHGFLWNMTWTAYQKTRLTLQHAGFSFSAWFHWRTIGQSEIYLQSHCSNRMRTFFGGGK